MFPISGSSAPGEVALGADGAIWFTDEYGKIGRMTTSGVVSEYAIPMGASQTSPTQTVPVGITEGPDGAIWFTEESGSYIGRVTTAGSITLLAIPLEAGGGGNEDITAGPDGALWFCQGGGIGRVTVAGSFSEFPDSALGQSSALGITSGPDGALWFADPKIARITTGGTLSQFTVPSSNSFPFYITAGSDGALWFTNEIAYTESPGFIGRVTTSGNFTDLAPYSSASIPSYITSGPDRAIWFSDYGTASIGRIPLQ